MKKAKIYKLISKYSTNLLVYKSIKSEIKMDYDIGYNNACSTNIVNMIKSLKKLLGSSYYRRRHVIENHNVRDFDDLVYRYCLKMNIDLVDLRNKSRENAIHRYWIYFYAPLLFADIRDVDIANFFGRKRTSIVNGRGQLNDYFDVGYNDIFKKKNELDKEFGIC